MDSMESYINRLRNAYSDIEVISGLPSLRDHDLLDPHQSKLVIIDDQVTTKLNTRMAAINKSVSRTTNLFTII